MNDTTKLEVRPDVAEFVTQVRARLVDLDEETRDELTGGLAADLSELVEERGPEVLGDPDDYTAELRAAAGLPPYRGRVGRSGAGDRAARWLESVFADGEQRWDRFVARPRVVPVWDFLRVLRPLWWAARAWVAVQLVDVFLGSWPHDYVPLLFGPVVGALVLVVAVVLSVQIGRGRLWPGSGGPGARTTLLGLNLAALVVALPVTWQVAASNGDRASPAYTYTQAPVSRITACNVYPYDAEGRPLTGVQLFDASGRPLNVGCSWRGGNKAWMLGDVRRWNVYPVGRRRDGEVVVPDPGRASVPAVTSPVDGIDTGPTASPSASSQPVPSASPSDPAEPRPRAGVPDRDAGR